MTDNDKRGQWGKSIRAFDKGLFAHRVAIQLHLSGALIPIFIIEKSFSQLKEGDGIVELTLLLNRERCPVTLIQVKAAVESAMVCYLKEIQALTPPGNFKGPGSCIK